MDVLVVDDERESPLVGEVFTAASGTEMIEKCRAYPIDLIILDIMMPGLDGLSALAEVYRINPECLGLIISAHEDFAFAQRAIRLRVVDYLLKPVSRQTLLFALERSVRHLVPNVPVFTGKEGETPLLPPPRPAPAGGPIAEACAFMAENYWRHSLSLEDVAARVGLSPCHFSRVFKEQTGENFTDHLTRLRLNAAARLLAETQAPIGRIALAVGYTDPNYLSRVFHHRIGITPREYRERVGQKMLIYPQAAPEVKRSPKRTIEPTEEVETKKGGRSSDAVEKIGRSLPPRLSGGDGRPGRLHGLRGQVPARRLQLVDHGR